MEVVNGEVSSSGAAGDKAAPEEVVKGAEVIEVNPEDTQSDPKAVQIDPETVQMDSEVVQVDPNVAQVDSEEQTEPEVIPIVEYQKEAGGDQEGEELEVVPDIHMEVDAPESTIKIANVTGANDVQVVSLSDDSDVETQSAHSDQIAQNEDQEEVASAVECILGDKATSSAVQLRTNDDETNDQSANKKEIEAIDLCDSGDEQVAEKGHQPMIKVIKIPMPTGSEENPEKDSQEAKTTNDEVIISGEKDDDPIVILEKDNIDSEDRGASARQNWKTECLADYQIECIKVPEQLQDCLRCGKFILCELMLEISNLKCYICSDMCLQEYRKLEKTSKTQIMSNSQSSQHADISESNRQCTTCNKVVNQQSLSWEVMDFCNEDCLAKHQTKIGSKCLTCNSDVSPSAMGKYCVRFGREIKQFCKWECLSSFKKNIKTCSYCQKNFPLDAPQAFVSGDKKESYFRDFCTRECLKKFDSITNKAKWRMSAGNCAVCAKTRIVSYEVLRDQTTVQLCSDLCMAAYKFVNKMKIGFCSMCKKYFDQSYIKELVIYQENQPFSFCCDNCMNISILSKRKILPCAWCKAKKYNFDMIHKKKEAFQNEDQILLDIYVCSLNCLTLYSVSKQPGGPSKQPCAECGNVNLCLYQLNMSDGTHRSFCSYDCVQEFTKLAGRSKKIIKVTSLFNNSGESPSVTKPNTPTVKNTITTVKKLGPRSAAPTQSDILKKLVPGPPPLVLKGKAPNKLTVAPNQMASATVIKNQVANILVKPREVVDIKNKMTQCRVLHINKGVSCKPNVNRKGVQTDFEEDDGNILRGLVPVPVPIYVPCPMAMYSIPVPTILPVPIPIPVPIFIPTTKTNAKQILDDIKRIQDKLPSDPFEAEILMMAEMVAGEKKDGESSEDSPSGSPPQRASESFMAEEVMEGSNSFGDDMLQMALKMASDLEGAPDLDGTLDNAEEPRGKKRTSDSPGETSSKRRRSGDYEKPDSQMALKFTLGVNAWRHFARNWNKEVELGKEGKRVKPDLLAMMPEELNASLTLFLKEAKMGNGSDYQPDVKFYLTLGIQYYLFESGRIDNIFSYASFTDVLDEEAQKFLTLYPEPEQVVTRVEEEHLWESKHLGAHSPHSLLTALIYFNTKNFNLTTVEEHMQLSFSQLTKHWKRSPSTTPDPDCSTSDELKNVYLRFSPCQAYLESNSKRKTVYEQYENKENPFRCPVRLYDFYLSRCPETAKSRNDVFYLEPERSGVAESPLWYSTNSLNETTLQKILNRVKMVKEINQSMQAPDFI